VYSVHLKGCFNVCKPASALFRQQRGGRIIAMSSTSGLFGNSGQANYAAAKDGIAGFVRVAARDLGRYGVTVNCIAPSASTRLTATVTPQAREARTRSGVQTGDRQAIAAQVLTGNNAPEGVAPIIVYLCTDHAANINGQIFFAREGLIGIMNQPATGRTISKNGRWTFEELAAAFPMTLGRDMVNPSPAQPRPAQPGQAAAPAQR
jgi:NAD(P)-dependent dehydrogenase (short-subunit alcohol dehydrogenase family)